MESIDFMDGIHFYGHYYFLQTVLIFVDSINVMDSISFYGKY